MVSAISITFCVIVGLFVLWAIFISLQTWLRWRQLRRRMNATLAKVRREQALLSEGLVPEFATPGDREDLMRRYLAGEDIPLRWRSPRR